MTKLRQNITERWGLCLFIFIAALSYLGTGYSLNKAKDFPESTLVSVRGQIESVALPADSKEDYRKIRLKLDRHTTLSLNLNLKRLPANIASEDIQRGAYVNFNGFYSRGKAARNPGAFNEKKWFRTQGITGKLAQAKLIELKPAPWYFRPLHLLDDFRMFSLQILEKSFSLQNFKASSAVASDFQLSSQGIMQALTMGHTGGMTAYTSKALSEAGAYHLVCVSGMHLMFFLLPFRKFLSWATISFKNQRKLLSIAAIFPAVLSGFGHGISRATLLYLLSSLDGRVQRRADKVNSLALAGIALLVLQPFAIRQNGFWMSFMAAGSLKLLEPKAKSSLFNALLSSLGVFLVILPFTAKQQQGANLLAPFANILLIPLATFLTIIGFLVLFLIILFPFLGHQINLLARFVTGPVLRLWLNLVSAVANCRSTFLCYKLLIKVMIGILVVAAIYFLLRSGVYKLAFSILLIFLMIILFSSGRQEQDQLEIIFLDVGQGDATLLLFSQGPTVLVDGGDSGNGYQQILPALRSQGRDHVDLAFVTHGHADHVVGVLELMSLGRVDCLLVPRLQCLDENEEKFANPVSEENPYNQNEFDWMSFLVEDATEKKLSVKEVLAGECFQLSKAQISFIAPTAADLSRSDDVNNTSLVFYLDYFEHSILFTGDMTQETEDRLVRTDELRPVEYLHVPHHGSKLSSGDKFLDLVKARWAIISAGKNNLYNHPHPETLERLRERNIFTIRLDESAAFFLQLFKADSRIVVWQ